MRYQHPDDFSSARPDMSATSPTATTMSDAQTLPVRASRWSQLWLGVVCMILIANLQYAWTLFVGPLHQAHGWKLADIQTAFVIFVALETWLTPVCGWLVDYLGPRRGPPLMIAFGGMMVAAGWITNAYAPSLHALYLGEIVSGAGAGAIYATCVGNAVKWFPDKRGLAVGLTAAGFGAGAALTVVPIRMLIEAAGYAQAFFWLGLGQGVVLLLLAPIMRAPLPGETSGLARPTVKQSLRNANPGQVLISPVFWLLYIMFTLISASGLMLTAQVAPIATDFGLAKTNLYLGASVLSTALVVDSVMNGLARPFFGFVSDRIGRELTMAVAFSVGACSYALLPVFGHTPWGFVICAGLAFFTFGEIFSLFPSTCTDLFGTRYATANASLLYTAKGTSVLLMPLVYQIIGGANDWHLVFTASAVANIVVVFAALGILWPVRRARHRAELARATAGATPPAPGLFATPSGVFPAARRVEPVLSAAPAMTSETPDDTILPPPVTDTPFTPMVYGGTAELAEASAQETAPAEREPAADHLATPDFFAQFEAPQFEAPEFEAPQFETTARDSIEPETTDLALDDTILDVPPADTPPQEGSGPGAAADRAMTAPAYHSDTVPELLRQGAADAAAIGAPGRPWMSYGALRDLAASVTAQLNGLGIGRGDRVAIVLPNGPEMATAFLTIACAATTAPLNPAYREEEFQFYLTDLGARALVIASGSDTVARQVAERLRIPVLELLAEASGPAGAFTLLSAGPIGSQASRPGPAEPDDIALVLHTSGTTSRPKIVPLSQINITASAQHIARSLELAPGDVCLNIMPLFHIHGLIAATLASLSAGAAVCCTPGFNAFRVFTWLEEVRPTWYTAVPTMHQAILQLAPRNATTIQAARLRFIRSSSASLPAPVMQALEDTFGVPVIEAYGMTEAAHQMAANPLPPAPRFPGAVGIAAGPEIAIMDAAGTLLARGELGEVVIRGRNVTAGYENNPKANAENFVNGWFRTGDQGIIDEQGYLRLTGRLKEQINRGGEKVSPLEIDAVLLDHPAVAQCLAFAVPHEKLGEEVAAAIVLREGASATEHELRDFAAVRLAQFKVPRTIVFLDEIPKGATGKLQRIGLAAKLGLA
jgi:oxalate/formate antiporter